MTIKEYIKTLPKDEKVILALSILGVIFVVALVWFADKTFWAPYRNQPEERVHVEVTGKRIRINDDSGSGDLQTTYTYIVAFTLPDSSVKELKVGVNKSKIYDSINEGDTGILTYKERKNIEEHIKDETRRWAGRRFISFEKDDKLG